MKNKYELASYEIRYFLVRVASQACLDGVVVASFVCELQDFRLLRIVITVYSNIIVEAFKFFGVVVDVCERQLLDREESRLLSSFET